MTDAKPTDPLALRLEEALLLSGVSQTRFGYSHFGDPAFFKKMREGRKFRRPMIVKIENVLKEYGV
jgi:hypothetical protein